MKTRVIAKPADPDARLADVIRAFVARYNYLHEWRIQKLVFYADLLSLSRRGYRLTSAGFKKHYFGVFSQDIRDSLFSSDDLEKKADLTPTGRPTVKYRLAGSLNAPTLSREDTAIIQEAHEATRSLTNEELADWGKETTLWRTTEQGASLNVEEYSKLIRGDTPEDVRRFLSLRAKTEARRARFKSVKELRKSLERG